MTIRENISIFRICFIFSLTLIALIPVITDSDYVIRLAVISLLWIGMAGCWNLMSGYTGYIDFGPVAYFGIGAYATATAMTRLGMGFFPSLIVAAVAALIIAIPIGLAALRLKGAYFAIATFAFAETVKQVLMEFDRTFKVVFFEGSHGITLPLSDHENTFFFYCFLAVSSVVFLIQLGVERSKFGYGLKAINESEIAAELAGVNTTGIKLRAYVTSAAFLAIFGGMEAYWITYITPADVFGVQRTVQMVIMTLLGGMGTLLGPVVGATFLTLLSEQLGTKFVEYYLVLVGIIIICIILLMPRGIIGTLKEKFRIRYI